MRVTRPVLVASGIACLALAVTSYAPGGRAARADNAPGAGFESFSLSATAPGVQFTYDFPGASTHPQAEGEVPQSIAQLGSGPQGYGLASVAWPGALAANAGSLAQLINLPLPSAVSNNANDPIRAEARTGSGPPTVTNTSVPGSVMTVTATPVMVSADAQTAGTQGPAPQSSSGNTESKSTATLLGPSSANATASSIVQHINLGGVVKIGAVTSTATASTTGIASAGSGETIVSGVEVGGQPAYIDQHGLHVGASSPGVPVNAQAAAIANQALGGAGMKFAVSQPSLVRKGARATSDSGNVVFFWAPPGDTNHDTFTATLGGASVSVGATPAIAGPSAGQGVVPPVPPLAGETVTMPGATDTGSGGTVQAPSDLASPAPSNASGGTSGSSDQTPLLPALTRTSAKLPRGLPPILPVLVALGSMLIAFGMRRLPDRVLEESATACTLGGNP
ncbi:MAG: hypothetical protein ACYDH6_21810 [Acidimicrobiales bacterium]